MEALLSLFSGLGQFSQVLLVVLICIVFWEPIAERIGWKKKDDPDEEEGSVLSLLLTQMQTLSEHYNHDTTEILTGIRGALQQLANGIDLMNKNQEALIKDHAESQELLRQFDKFGVKVRDCDVKS